MPTQNSPIYLFLGEENFLKEEAIEKLKLQYLDTANKGFDYSVFYGKEKDFSFKEMLDTLNTMPFLSKSRIVVLKDADGLSNDLKQAVLAYLKKPKETSLFVIETPMAVIKEGFILEISRFANLRYFRPLTESGIRNWLANISGLYDKKITSDAIDLLMDTLPNDLRIMASNIDNIILYIGSRGLITKQDVSKIVGLLSPHTAFELIDSIDKKDSKEALRIFSTLNRDKRKETELLGLLAWNSRMLLRAKEFLQIKNKLEIAKELGLNPRAIDKLINRAQLFKKGDILKLLDSILQSDLDIKTGLPPDIIMERLIVKMSQG